MNRPDTNHVEEFCRPGQGAHCCRYLVMDRSGWLCVKHHQDARSVIEYRVASGTMTAIGDNCAGLREQ